MANTHPQSIFSYYLSFNPKKNVQKSMLLHWCCPLRSIFRSHIISNLISNLRSHLRSNLRSDLRLSFTTHFSCQKDCSMSNVFYSQRESWGRENLAVAILSSILNSILSSILNSILSLILRSNLWLLIRSLLFLVLSLEFGFPSSSYTSKQTVGLINVTAHSSWWYPLNFRDLVVPRRLYSIPPSDSPPRTIQSRDYILSNMYLVDAPFSLQALFAWQTQQTHPTV